ncbi:MAG TPA: Stk1 family PASTA domain-containing Ser/Thr kinase [Actinotalea sp.]
MDDAPRILGGRYEVGEIIGRGGMAEVHIGQDTRLGRTVAIKILRSDLARDPSFQARFRREAQAAASLNHPSIVAVYDTGEDIFTEPNGSVAHVPFIVMEYVEGHTVRDILRDGAAVPIEEAVEITAGVLSALEYSHHAGIVHRDIKPANVMLTPTGAVKVMDFGIARAMADAAGTMTQTQAVIGTAQYLSPEQARGEQVDARSDLYSTGCLLFELLTGRPPFIGDSPVAVAYQHAREEAQAPSTFASDVPDSLDRITMKALAKDREDRYSTAAEFRSDLESAVRGGHITAPAVGALAAGAATTALLDGPPTASTQVIGAAGPATQVVPAAAPWSQVGLESRAPARPALPETIDDERGRPWLMWVFLAIAVAALVGIFLLLTRGDGTPETTMVSLVKLDGMTEQAAQEAVTGANLKYTPLTEPSSTVEKGTVIRSDPEGPKQLAKDTEVKVYVSSGADSAAIPDMTNWTQDQAKKELARLGFADPDVTTENSTNVEKDKVTKTDPAAGQTVPLNQTITIYLSTGQVELPNLVGQLEADAQAKLVELGLVPTITHEVNADAPPGTVFKQSRTEGLVPQRSAIELTIADAPAAPANVAVPDVSGLSYSEAAKKLGEAGLNATAGDDVFDPKVKEGKVVKTDPAATTEVPEGSTITVFVSKGPDPAAPPPPAP